MNKKQMRAIALAKRDGLTEKKRQDYSGIIVKTLTGLSCYQKAEAVLTYVSFRSEVDTFGLIRLALQDGKAVFAPKVSGRDMAFFRIYSEKDLQKGYQGILEPEETEPYIDYKSQEGRTLICLPGAAFDKSRHRIGYGGGFYDRFLWGMRERSVETVIMTALAFDCQIFEEIPWEDHDICPHCIVTEKEIIGGKETDYGKHEQNGDSHLSDRSRQTGAGGEEKPAKP